MSGHSHWARIKHKKALVDARRGKNQSKLVKAVMSAARQGGGDVKHNLKLQYAIEKAKAGNVNKDTIERAIKKGTGELEGEVIEETTFEGYGPGGVAILIEALTDNRNRSVHELKKIFEKGGGSLAAANSVAFLFERKGLLSIAKEGVTEDAVLEAALEAGADEMKPAEDVYEVTCAFGDYLKVKEALEKKFKLASADISWIPKTITPVDEDAGRKLLNLLDNIEEHDDVQNVYSNYDLPKSLDASLQASA